MQNYAPPNLAQLQQRCAQLKGRTISDLANSLELKIPANLLHAKGWVGQLLELYLGATASSKAEPDFPNLGIELKTIPISATGKPLESTFVCSVQSNNMALNWHDSWVYNKLKTVLWVPIISPANMAIMDRIITEPILWQMHANSEIEQTLKNDWEELMEMLQLGYGKNLSAKFGTFLHIRPKAANSRVLIDYLDAEGNATQIVPKGFYLRSSFTQYVLQNYSSI